MYRLAAQCTVKSTVRHVLRRTVAIQCRRPLVTVKTPVQMLVRHPNITNTAIRRMATVNEKPALQYKETPFVKWKLFPDFESVLAQTSPETAVPVFEEMVKTTRDRFLALEKELQPTWDGTIGQFSELEDELSRAFSLLSHLNGVRNSPELRTTLETLQPQYVQLGLMMNQSRPKYQALQNLKSSTEWNRLDKVQQRIVDKALRSMKNAGIGLAEGSPEQKRFNEISERLSHLSLKFSNNVLDATKAFKLVVTDKTELDGCSDKFLQTLRKNGERLGEKEGYCITLDPTIYVPFMMNCSNRALREKIYRANITKASEGALNNEPIINEILALKQEKAALLGYKTHADLSLSVKMAQTLSSAEELLDQLSTSSIPHAKKEVNELTQFAARTLNQDGPLQPWDTAYVSEQYRKALFKYDEETISQYFPFPKVLQGLFDVANEVLGIQVKELDTSEMAKRNITTWHEDVKVFEVSENGNIKAYFYGDFYSRPSEKRGGAWMDIVTTRQKHRNGERTLPVAHLVCNQAPPRSDDEPSLMQFRDVETLFHEFGHCLQHMMTHVEYADASGLNGIEWDFVEVASQFMENFCSEPVWLERLSGHYKTGEAMPNEMIHALVKNREFLSGMAMLRQLHFAKVDLALHSRFTPPLSASDPTVFDMDAEIAKDIVLIPRLNEDRFLCSFNHIFGGGYSAGYYSYKWSETYSADAYAAFEEAKEKGESIKHIGKRYRETVLALGGGTEPREVWKLFRGREYADVNALLRHSGLLDNDSRK
ncbi:hypothetical protein EC973_008580 [Apophysomyces ossiformis]|uniref:oligopeptidase A n=1 Tax=Apophysomyces ossiformis TaxID=679940 RepID=A0A8H7BSM0_9FUNG|nr:hypothetical protein EC973_008580 [Apophysomyces ossiformis]